MDGITDSVDMSLGRFQEVVWIGTSLVAQTVKRLSTMWDTWVQSLGQEDPLEKGMDTRSGGHSCLGNPMDGGACWATVHGVTKSWTQLSGWAQDRL